MSRRLKRVSRGRTSRDESIGVGELQTSGNNTSGVISPPFENFPRNNRQVLTLDLLSVNFLFVTYGDTQVFAEHAILKNPPEVPIFRLSVSFGFHNLTIP
jgi:hypothetical protein